jgi:hypothetical protein
MCVGICNRTFICPRRCRRIVDREADPRLGLSFFSTYLIQA